MKQLTKKLLVLITGVLLVALFLSSCGIDGIESNDISDEARQNFIEEMIYAEDAELLFSPVIEEARTTPAGYTAVSRGEGSQNGLTGMYLILKNKNYELYIDFQTTDIAVLDLKENFVYHSNPDRVSDVSLAASQKQTIASPLSLEAYDASGKRYSFNFYANCQEEGSFYVVKKGENTLRLIYTIGNDPDKNLFPPVVTKSTYEDRILKDLEECYEKGDIDSSKYKAYLKLLSNCYKYVTPNPEKASEALSPEDIERFRNTFPTIDVMSLYISYDNVTSKQKKQIKELMETIGFTAKDVKKEMEKADYQGPERSVLYTIPVDLSLNENGLSVSVDTSLILGPTKQRLYSVNVYRGLGANSGGWSKETEKANEGACLIVPDGSGALIPLSGGLSTSAFKGRIYGADNSFAKEYDTSASEQVLAPYIIFDRGVASGEKASFNAGGIVAVMEEGAGQSSVVARPLSGTSNPVASINYEFIYSERDYRTYSTSSADANSEDGSGLLLSKEDVSGVYRIQYLFTEGGQSYSEHAAALREYFIKKGFFPSEALTEKELPLFIDLIGCVDLNSTVLGVPVKTETALTTYSQALEILKKLKDSGVSNVVARYSYWANGGENNTAANDLDLLNCMGTKSDLSALVQFCDDNDMGFFPSVEFLHVTSTLNGFSKSQDAARRMNRSTATIVDRMNAIGSLREDLKEKILVSSKVSVEMAESYKASFEEVISTKSIAVGDIGKSLHSSYKTNDGVSRSFAEKDMVKILDTFADYNIAVSTGNFYTWNSASHIFGLPSGSSEYQMESSAIPFAQILLHGYVNYSIDPVNQSGDYETALLLALETGSAFSFRWMGAQDSIFDYTSYYDYFSLNYNGTFDRAVDLYKEAASVLNDVVNKPITNHEAVNAYYALDHEGLIGWLTAEDEGYVEGENTPAVKRVPCNGVFATVYGDAKVIIVNYNSDDVELNDRTVVKAKSYLVLTVKEYKNIINGSAYEPLPEPPAAEEPVQDETTQEG